MPPPTEAQILSSFLITPASLPTLLPYPKFLSLFPKATHSNPQIKTLYRELQHQRNLDIELVEENIEREVRRGRAVLGGLRRAVLRDRERGARRGLNHDGTQGNEEIDAADAMEIDIDSSLFTQAANLDVVKPHSLETLLPEMESAVNALEAEIEAIEARREALLEEMKATVGELSDLRYGKFARAVSGSGTVKDEVESGLKTLSDVCES